MKKNREWRAVDLYALKKTLFIMRWTLLFFFLGIIQALATETYAQKTKLELNFSQAKLEQVLNEIERQSEFYFLYNQDLINTERKVDIQAKGSKIDEVLVDLFNGTDIHYTIIDRQIVLTNSTDQTSLVMQIASQQQGRKVSGKVTDTSGAPLPGVTIVVKSTTTGIITDANGYFLLENIPEKATLQFSFVGMKKLEVVVGNQTFINVTMEVESIGIDEVVAVGFGTKKKTNITGATSTVVIENLLSNRPVTNVLSAIQGSIPGLQITNSSGQPGSNTGINIRGVTSINGGSPLILIDNIPVNAQDINPQDVESITVLKDAASASIYGSRAAFGVVLITTKKGKRNQPVKFNFSNTIAVNRATDIPDKASPYDFVNALNDWGTTSYWTGQDIGTWKGLLEQYKSNPGSFPEGYSTVNGLRYPLAETDVMGAWLNDPGFSQINNLSVSGGSEKTSFRVSSGFSDEDGIIVTKNDRYTKYNVNAYLNTNLADKLSLTTNILYLNSVTTSPVGSYYSAITFLSCTPADGYYTFDDGTKMLYNTPANSEKARVAPKTNQDKIRIFGKLDFTPFEGLKISGEYTFEKTTNDNVSIGNGLVMINPMNFNFAAFRPEDTFYAKSNAKTVYQGANLYANYSKTFGNHNLSGLVGVNREEFGYDYIWGKRMNLISTEVPSISTATGVISADDDYYEWAVMGCFGRLNYDYLGKYMLEINGRYDGSSRFPRNSRFGFFPSISAGWNIAKESFMEDVKFITKLKMRGSWGEVGNQELGSQYYPAVPAMNPVNAGWINESTGISYLTLQMPGLVSSAFTWENVETKNIGLDVNFLNNHLSSSFDFFIRNTKGMLTQGEQLPSILGSNAPLQNAANLKSEGWELELSWKDKIGKFYYNLGFSISDNQGTITKFGNKAGLIDNYYIGKKTNEIWGYETDRYYTVDDFVEGTLNANLMNGKLKEGIPAVKGRTPNPGDILYKDLNNDGEIFSGNNTLENPGDRKIIGNSTRRFQYGIFGDVSYKNFDISFLMNGVGKRDIWMDTPIRFPYVNEFNVVYASQLDYWTPKKTDAFFPRNYSLGGVNYPINRYPQTKYLLDGSYLSIKNITIGYSLPNRFLSKLKIDKLRVYIAGENLLDFNHYPDGINTELEIKEAGGTYPYMKSYSAGFNLIF